MAAAQNHDYHLVQPSIWPFIGALSAFIMFLGTAFWMHKHGLVTRVAIQGIASVPQFVRDPQPRGLCRARNALGDGPV